MDYTHTNSQSSETDRNGSYLYQNNIDPGNHTLQVFGLYDIFWSKESLVVDEDIDAIFQCIGLEEGSEVTFLFFARMGDGATDECLDSVVASISGDEAIVPWKYPSSLIQQSSNEFYQALVYFEVHYRYTYAMAQEIPLYADLKLCLKSDIGEPEKDRDVEIKLSNGRFIKKKTDSRGEVIVRKVPPCMHKVKFPALPSAEREDDVLADPFVKNARRLPAYALGDTVNFFHVITLYYYCLHKSGAYRRCASNTSIFEVVPDVKGDNKYKDIVTILMPDDVTLSSSGTVLEESPREGGMYARKLTCELDISEKVPEFWKKEFWTGLVKPKEYPISGLPKSLTVKCYRPDMFKLQVQFPPLAKSSYGVEYTANRADVLSNMARGKKTELKANKPTVEANVWSGEKIPRPFDSDTPVSIIRNDQELKLQFMKAVGSIIELVEKIESIKKAITNSLPQAGWYFKFESQFLVGTFVLEWGWKEYTDHRAYYYVGANINLKLIELKLEIGVGIDVGPVKLQVYGSITGSVMVGFKGARVSPDGKAEFSAPFGAEIVGALGARCEAESFIKIEGMLETGLKIEGGFLKYSKEDGVSIECGLQWTGLVVKASVTIKGKKQGNEPAKDKGGPNMVHELIGSSDLGKWTWPKSEYKYKPQVMPRKDFRDLLIKVLEKGTNVRVKTDDKWYGNKYMKPEQIAIQIEEVIHNRPGLTFDGKTGEALALEIREALVDLMEKHGLFTYDHMTESDLQGFVKGSKLQEILDGYKDELQDLIDEYSEEET